MEEDQTSDMEDMMNIDSNSNTYSSDEPFSWGSSADSMDDTDSISTASMMTACQVAAGVSDEKTSSDHEELKTLAATKKEIVEGQGKANVNVNVKGIDFYNCNICLDVARNPVVTHCGHLFCWPCIFHWLHIHSKDKECPVCKGQVSDDRVIPIYGRGNVGKRNDQNLTIIPPRPLAKRFRSLRESIERRGNKITFSELVYYLGSRIHTGDFDPEAAVCISILKRFLTSRAIRREHADVYSADETEITTNRPASVSTVRAGPPHHHP